MPLNTLQQVLTGDKLSEGRVKLNNNLEALRVFANSLESESLVPEDIQNLIVNGKINPDYLPVSSGGSVTASDVSVADIAGYFTGTTVEAVLAEIYAMIDAIEATSGTAWLSGTVIPASGLGVVGDFYVDTTSNFVYKKTGASTWTFQFSMKGDSGDGSGDVVGPASAITTRLAAFADGTGKVIQDSGFTGVDFATSIQGTKADNAVPNTREILVSNSLIGGGPLSSDVSIALVGDEFLPGANQVYGTDGTGTRGWKDDPGGAGFGDVVGPASSVSNRIATFLGTTGKSLQDSGSLVSDLVPTSRTVSGVSSLEGGGSLAGNISLSLQNDSLTPNANHVYGTDGLGARGWKPDPAGTTATSVTVSVNRTLTNADHNKILVCTVPLTITLPDSLQTDFQAIVFNISNGLVSIIGSGTSTLEPGETVLNNSASTGISVATLTHLSGGNWYILSSGSSGVPVAVTVTTDRTISSIDQNTILLCTQPVVITLPDSLSPNLQFSVLNVSSGIVSFVGSGTSTLVPSSVVLDNTTGAEITVASVMHHTGGTWYLISSATGDIQAFVVMLTDMSTSITTGIKKASFRMPYGFYITDIRAFTSEASVGDTRLTVDVNENSVTILSTKLSFNSGEKTTTTSSIPAVISDNILANDSEITFDVDSVGNTEAGIGLGVSLIGYRV